MKKIVTLIFILLLSSASYASDGIGLSRGFSGVDGMDGFALHYNRYWGNITNIGNDFELTGLWDFSLSYWSTDRSKNTEFSNITVVSLLPIFRLQRRFAYDNGIAPFVDLGYGLAVYNRNQFSNQKLGGYGGFNLSTGFGLTFGQQSQYDLAYHYMTYNNAGQFKEDDGMYVNTISFTYHFAD